MLTNGRNLAGRQAATRSQAQPPPASFTGILRSGEVRIGFPPEQPYNAVSGIDVTAFGIPRAHMSMAARS